MLWCKSLEGGDENATHQNLLDIHMYKVDGGWQQNTVSTNEQNILQRT